MISVKAVAAPAALCVLSAIILLANTSLRNGGIIWMRKVVEESTGESIGMCYHGKDGTMIVIQFVGLLLVFVPVVLTGYMAWRTRDVDSLYSESYYIFWLITGQFEIVLLFSPILYTLKNDPNGLFIAVSIIYWAIADSTLAIIMLPKILRVHWPKIMTPVERTRGTSNGVVVSGVNSNHRPCKSSKSVSQDSLITNTNNASFVRSSRSSRQYFPRIETSVQNIDVECDV